MASGGADGGSQLTTPSGAIAAFKRKFDKLRVPRGLGPRRSTLGRSSLNLSSAFPVFPIDLGRMLPMINPEVEDDGGKRDRLNMLVIFLRDLTSDPHVRFYDTIKRFRQTTLRKREQDPSYSCYEEALLIYNDFLRQEELTSHKGSNVSRSSRGLRAPQSEVLHVKRRLDEEKEALKDDVFSQARLWALKLIRVDVLPKLMQCYGVELNKPEALVSPSIVHHGHRHSEALPVAVLDHSDVVLTLEFAFLLLSKPYLDFYETVEELLRLPMASPEQLTVAQQVYDAHIDPQADAPICFPPSYCEDVQIGLSSGTVKWNVLARMEQLAVAMCQSDLVAEFLVENQLRSSGGVDAELRELIEVLDSDTRGPLFLSFATKLHTEDPVLYYFDVDKWRSAPVASKDRINLAKRIYTKFLDPAAVRLLGAPSDFVDEVKGLVESMPAHVAEVESKSSSQGDDPTASSETGVERRLSDRFQWLQRVMLGVIRVDTWSKFKTHHFYHFPSNESQKQIAERKFDMTPDVYSKLPDSPLSAPAAFDGADVGAQSEMSLYSTYSEPNSADSYRRPTKSSFRRFSISSSRTAQLHFPAASSGDDISFSLNGRMSTSSRGRSSKASTALRREAFLENRNGAVVSVASVADTAEEKSQQPDTLSKSASDSVQLAMPSESKAPQQHRARRATISATPHAELQSYEKTKRLRRYERKLKQLPTQFADVKQKVGQESDLSERVRLFNSIMPLAASAPGPWRGKSASVGSVHPSRATPLSPSNSDNTQSAEEHFAHLSDLVMQLKQNYPELLNDRTGIRRRTVVDDDREVIESEEDGDEEEDVENADAAKPTQRSMSMQPSGQQDSAEKAPDLTRATTTPAPPAPPPHPPPERKEKKKKKRVVRVRFSYDGNDPSDDVKRKAPGESLLKTRNGPLNARMETFEEAVVRVFQERMREQESLTAILSKGATFKKYNSLQTSDKRWFAVTEDGTELIWEKAIVHQQGGGNWLSHLVANRKSKPLASAREIRYSTYWSDRFQRYNIRQKPPWLGFTIFFPDRTLDIVCNDEQEVTVWFLGLQALIPLTNTYLSKGGLLWERARLKVELQAEQQRTTEKKVWAGLIMDAKKKSKLQKSRAERRKPQGWLRGSSRNGDPQESLQAVKAMNHKI